MSQGIAHRPDERIRPGLVSNHGCSFCADILHTLLPPCHSIYAGSAQHRARRLHHPRRSPRSAMRRSLLRIGTLKPHSALALARPRPDPRPAFPAASFALTRLSPHGIRLRTGGHPRARADLAGVSGRRSPAAILSYGTGSWPTSRPGRTDRRATCSPPIRCGPRRSGGSSTPISCCR